MVTAKQLIVELRSILPWTFATYSFDLAIYETGCKIEGVHAKVGLTQKKYSSEITRPDGNVGGVAELHHGPKAVDGVISYSVL